MRKSKMSGRELEVLADYEELGTMVGEDGADQETRVVSTSPKEESPHPPHQGWLQ